MEQSIVIIITGTVSKLLLVEAAVVGVGRSDVLAAYGQVPPLLLHLVAMLATG